MKTNALRYLPINSLKIKTQNLLHLNTDDIPLRKTANSHPPPR